MITGLIAGAGFAAAITLMIIICEWRDRCNVERVKKDYLLARQRQLLEDAMEFKSAAQFPDALWVMETQAALEYYQEIKDV